jgi:hypothetical protein
MVARTATGLPASSASPSDSRASGDGFPEAGKEVTEADCIVDPLREAVP